MRGRGSAEKRKEDAAIPDGFRRCSGCKEVKELTRKFFYASKAPRDRGFLYRCIVCQSKRYAVRRIPTAPDSDPSSYVSIAYELQITPREVELIEKRALRKLALMHPELKELLADGGFSSEPPPYDLYSEEDS